MGRGIQQIGKEMIHNLISCWGVFLLVFFNEQSCQHLHEPLSTDPVKSKFDPRGDSVI